MSVGTRVVFDCNIFLQAVSAPKGPAGRCIQLVFDKKLALFFSPRVFEELCEVLSRPTVFTKLKLTPVWAERFLEAIESVGMVLNGFAKSFTYDRDPDDAHYVNLALAANADFIVSRDKDLFDLMDVTRPEAVGFQGRFPAIRILTPVGLLLEVDV